MCLAICSMTRIFRLIGCKMRFMLISRVVLPAVAVLLFVSCGTVGSLASPTPVSPTSPLPTETPTFTDTSKAEILDEFNKQVAAINAGDWAGAYAICSPDYRSRRSLERFESDVTQLLGRYGVTPATFDARNVQVTKGRDDRFSISYDSYIDGQFSERVDVGGAYVRVSGQWYDDDALCP